MMEQVAAAAEAAGNEILGRQQAQAEANEAPVGMDTTGLAAVTTDAEGVASLEEPTTATVEVVPEESLSPPATTTTTLTAEPAALGAAVVEEEVADEEVGTTTKKKSPKRKRTSTRAKSSSALKRPKRPRTAYHFFYDSRRKEELDKDPSKDNNDLSKQIGEEWKVLKDEDKGPYETEAATAKAEYESACRDYEAASGKKMEDCEPKKPLTAYMIFFQARHLEEKAKGADAVEDFSKQVGAEWKDMSEEAKQPYYDQSRDSKTAYERQVAFLQKAKADLVGQTFVDLLRDGATASVATYDDDKDVYTLAYDGSPEPVLVAAAELRARVCGDDKASKRANKPKKSHGGGPSSGAAVVKDPSAVKKRKKSNAAAVASAEGGKDENTAKDAAVPTTGDDDDDAVLGGAVQATTDAAVLGAPGVVPGEDGAPSEEAAAKADDKDKDKDEPAKKKKKKEPSSSSSKLTKEEEKEKASLAHHHPSGASWMNVGKDDVMSEEDMLNVVRLSRRLVGGACVQNLKKMCGAIHVPVSGSKSVLGTRLELYLRHHDFKNNDFLPSADDVDDLSIEQFNEKYENEEPVSIDKVVDVLSKIQQTFVQENKGPVEQTPSQDQQQLEEHQDDGDDDDKANHNDKDDDDANNHNDKDDAPAAVEDDGVPADNMDDVDDQVAVKDDVLKVDDDDDDGDLAADMDTTAA